MNHHPLKESQAIERLKAQILTNCPLKTDDDPNCSRCQFKIEDSQKLLLCHCGRKLKVKVLQTAKNHWKTGPCVLDTEQLRLSDRLIRENNSQNQQQSVYEVACAGLSDETWLRSRSLQSLSVCIRHSPSTYHGHPPRHEVCTQLFGTRSELLLSEDQKHQLHRTLQAQSVWYINREGGNQSIHSTKCHGMIQTLFKDTLITCNECLAIKTVSSLNSAINRQYADEETMKYISNTTLSEDQFQVTRDKILGEKLASESVEQAAKADSPKLWDIIAEKAKRGLFDNHVVFKALVEAMSSKAERLSHGHSLAGIIYRPELDNWLITAGAYSSGVVSLFRDNFAGRSPRSQREERRTSGSQLLDGLQLANMIPVKKWIEKLGYSGPLVAGTDQTVCLKALRQHDGSVVGAQGGDIKFVNSVELENVVKDILARGLLCDKIRCYTVQVPLPNMPSFIVALIASKSKENSADILSQHLKFIELLDLAGLPIVSLGSDGAASELSAQLSLTASTSQYLKYDHDDLNVHVKVGLFGKSNLPIVTVQDPKHARKTAANQVLSGARLLAFGKYYTNIENLLSLRNLDECPLGLKDIKNVDPHDDGRALRTFHHKTLKLASELNDVASNSDTTGLTVYLFIMGELSDAWLNPTMGHFDRIICSWRTVFFVRDWNTYLIHQKEKTNNLMNPNINFISHQSFKIFVQLAESLIGLVIAHREYWPKHPLILSKHGTEACEHSFGWMRVISPDFTVLGAREMMPKIFAIVKSITSGTIKVPQSDNLHSGYQYSFADENPNPNWALLTKFPSDEEITCALKIARLEADVLKEFVGNDIPHSPISSTTRIKHVNPALWTQEPKQFYDDISTSINHDYQETNVPPLTVSEALSTAAEIHANDEAANSIVGQLSQRIEDELYSSFQLPNLGSSQTKSTHSEITNCQPMRSLLTNSSSTLNCKNLVKLRYEHNSAVSRHHGNERMKNKPSDFPAPTVDNTAKVSDMKPSQCSKILSMLYQENCVQLEPIRRHKRWNMTAKIPASDIFRTVDLKIPVIATKWLDSGQLSELNPLKRHKWVIIIKDSTLYIGRILGIYENSNQKHSVVETAASPSNLSFISVVMGRYQHGAIEVSWDPDNQNSYYYVHISPNRLAHIFQESKDEEFKFLQPGHHSISPKVQMILQSISISTWTFSFEKTLSALKAAGKDPLA